MNSVNLIGNLTRDVELRYTPAGTAVADVGIAINERVKRGNDWVDDTSFIDVTVFGRPAEVLALYASKGSQVGIDGRLKQDRWEQDGQKRSKVKVIANRVVLCGSKRDNSEYQKPAEPVAAVPDDEIPF